MRLENSLAFILRSDTLSWSLPIGEFDEEPTQIEEENEFDCEYLYEDVDHEFYREFSRASRTKFKSARKAEESASAASTPQEHILCDDFPPKKLLAAFDLNDETFQSEQTVTEGTSVAASDDAATPTSFYFHLASTPLSFTPNVPTRSSLDKSTCTKEKSKTPKSKSVAGFEIFEDLAPCSSIKKMKSQHKEKHRDHGEENAHPNVTGSLSKSALTNSHIKEPMKDPIKSTSNSTLKSDVSRQFSVMSAVKKARHDITVMSCTKFDTPRMKIKSQLGGTGTGTGFEIFEDTVLRSLDRSCKSKSKSKASVDSNMNTLLKARKNLRKPKEQATPNISVNKQVVASSAKFQLSLEKGHALNKTIDVDSLIDYWEELGTPPSSILSEEKKSKSNDDMDESNIDHMASTDQDQDQDQNQDQDKDHDHDQDHTRNHDHDDDYNHNHNQSRSEVELVGGAGLDDCPDGADQGTYGNFADAYTEAGNTTPGLGRSYDLTYHATMDIITATCDAPDHLPVHASEGVADLTTEQLQQHQHEYETGRAQGKSPLLNKAEIGSALKRIRGQSYLPSGLGTPTAPHRANSTTTNTAVADSQCSVASPVVGVSPLSQEVLCVIKRDKASVQDAFFPRFFLLSEFNKEVLIMAKRMSVCNRNASYHFFDMTKAEVNQKYSKSSANYLGKLRALNSERSEYELLLTAPSSSSYSSSDTISSGNGIGNGGKHQSARISIDKNGISTPNNQGMSVGGIKSNGARRMRVAIPIPEESPSPLALRSSSGRVGIVIFDSVDPVLDTSTGKCSHGRAKVSSVKNFQLVEKHNPSGRQVQNPPGNGVDGKTNDGNGRHSEGGIDHWQDANGSGLSPSCQCGKVDDYTFNLGYKAPLNACQAFAIALSQFDA